jgi:hypothetical protein
VQDLWKMEKARTQLSPQPPERTHAEGALTSAQETHTGVLSSRTMRYKSSNHSICGNLLWQQKKS